MASKRSGSKTEDLKATVEHEISQERKLPRWEDFTQNLVPCGTRISKEDKVRLEHHFETRGLRLSQGLRMIISEYMEHEHIR